MSTILQHLVRIGTDVLPLTELARRAEVDVPALQRAQRGEILGWDIGMLTRLSRVVGVDPALALAGGTPPVPTLLAFLREATAGEVQPQDTLVLRGALSRAAGLRIAGLRPVHSYEQRSAPGLKPYNAGYAAARRVRKDLRMESSPIVDLRGLVEDRLGVLVVAVRLETPKLEALALADKNGAAVVLNAVLSQRPTLWRRSIAHELCHLLFDPRDQQAIVDVLSEGESELPIPEGQRKNREQRARAFAAELLVPLKGLKERYSPKCSGVDQARCRVEETCIRFGAPWELVVHHLANHDLIGGDDAEKLLLEHPSVDSPLGVGRSAALEWARRRVSDGELSEGRARDLFGTDWPLGDVLSA